MATIESVRTSIDVNIKTNGQQEITGKVLNSVLHDVVDLSFNDKGKYPSVTAGFANNLVGRGEAVDATINFRASGGKSIEDGAARVKELKGNSVVWNQMLRTTGYTNKQTDTKSYFDYYFSFSSSGKWANLETKSVQNSGVLVGIYDIPSNVEAIKIKHNGSSRDLEVAMLNSTKFSNHKVLFSAYVNSANPSVVDGLELDNMLFIDLTQMFGEGNEPSTLEEFYSRIPQNVDLYAYNEGEIVSTNAEGIKSVGFNAWDGVMYEGFVDDADGNIGNIGKNTGFIRILPNTDYYIKTSAKVGQWGAWYDEQKKYISGFTGYNKVHKSPSNAAFMCCTCMYTGVDNADDFCINLAHSGYRNGEYQPYMQFIRDIDSRIREAFPNGMKSAGSAYDEVRWNGKKETWEAVKRIGVVKFKDLSWGANETNAQFYSKIVDINSTATWGAVGMLCKDYSYVKARVHSSENNLKLSNYNGYVYVADSTFANLSYFLGSRGETDLYYELAEPIVTELGNDINLDYEVWDFGTEQMLSTKPSAPIKASIVYGFNAVDNIRTAQLEIEALKTQIAQMQTLMASLTAQPAMLEE